MTRSPENPQLGIHDAVTFYDRDILQFIQTEASHGLDHAQKTADLTYAIAEEPEYAGKLDIDDLIALRHAALLHDIGYNAAKPYWSGMQEEHPMESAFVALEVLQHLDYYKDKPKQLGTVLWLIYNHDNTNYTFPAFWLFEETLLERNAPHTSVPRLIPGTVRGLPEKIQNILGENTIPHLKNINDKYIDLLQILQEADSRLGDAQRTLNFCRKRGVPIFKKDTKFTPSLGISSLWWQKSAAANIILALNRGLLDAHTKTGQHIARSMYHEGFDFIYKLYEEELKKSEQGKHFVTTSFAKLRDEDIDKIFRRDRANRWWNEGFATWTFIESARDLQGTVYDIEKLMGEKITDAVPNLIPLDTLIKYRSTFPSMPYDSDKEALFYEVREAIIEHYAIDILTQISGVLNIQVNEVDPYFSHDIVFHTIRPPTIGVPSLQESSNVDTYESLLIHDEWIHLAQDTGLDRVQVVFARKDFYSNTYTKREQERLFVRDFSG